MMILKDGQHIFIGDIIDVTQKESQQVICSGKVQNFIEVDSICLFATYSCYAAQICGLIHVVIRVIKFINQSGAYIIEDDLNAVPCHSVKGHSNLRNLERNMLIKETIEGEFKQVTDVVRMI